MSDAIKHECGIAMVRLLKPLEYYRKKYGDVFWGMNKLYLLMEKQHNRGQEGAGMASVKLNARPGEEYIFRERAEGTGAIQDIFSAVHRAITECRRIEPEVPDEELPFIGEMYMGHLRYSTTGRSGISYLHPFLRRNNWRSRNLSLAGNFNLTNVDEILQYIVERGQHPRHNADTFIILEQLGYLLDYEVEHLYRRFKAEGLAGQAMNDAIEENIDIEHILQEASARWDGGYVITGLLGSGDLFAFRDPHGIRPAFYYASDEVIVVASERPVIQTVFDLPVTEVKELMPGQSIVVKRNGNMMMQGLEAWLDRQKSEEICARNGQLSSAQIREILSRQIRTEKLAIKDIKLRTFIAEGNSRNDLAAHVYDTTYGTVREGVDSIVVIDDSIVRGTTLRQSIIKILCRQKPKKIVIVSSSPQIRYPDCYGIDMSKMGEFIAFHAAIALLKERRLERVIDEVYTKSKAQIALPKEKVVNYVKEIYAPFTDEEISAKIAEMITPENCPSEIAVVYQTIDHLHQACPNHSGDWYFSGDYPTPGGNRLVNGAFVEWYEKRFNS